MRFELKTNLRITVSDNLNKLLISKVAWLLIVKMSLFFYEVAVS